MNNQEIIFEVKQSSKNIHIEHVFLAKLDLLWKAFSEYQVLEKWSAPDPYTIETIRMLFEPGGAWLYAASAPNQETYYNKVSYMDIDPLHSMETMDSFCDAEGKIDRSIPVTKRVVSFNDIDGNSARLIINIDFEAEEDVAKYMDRGFQEAFVQTLNKLETVLQNESNNV